jgi:hypothetical protein
MQNNIKIWLSKTTIGEIINHKTVKSTSRFINKYVTSQNDYMSETLNKYKSKPQPDEEVGINLIKNIIDSYLKDKFIGLLNNEYNDIKIIKPLNKDIEYTQGKDSRMGEYTIQMLIPNVELKNKEEIKKDLMTKIKEKFINDSILKDAFDIDINNENYDTFIKKYNDKTKLSKMISLTIAVIKLLNDSEEKIEFGKEICKNRLIEGKYINESLKILRGDLKSISEIKNKNTIFYSPDFTNICLNAYCPSEENCFELVSSNKEVKLQSPIFQYIYKYLHGKNDKLTEESFCTDIIIAIFCVFNISKQANNPPSVIYIDINKLKYLFELYKKNNKNTGEIVEELEILSKKYTEYVDEIKDIMTSSNEVNMFKIKIQSFIETISNINASTSIGTLEFTDSIAKLNTTNLVCTNSNYKNLQPL